MNECPVCGEVISKRLCMTDCCRDLRKQEKLRAEFKCRAAEEMYNMLQDISESNCRCDEFAEDIQSILARARGELL